jgi:D-alanine transaminase
LGSGLIEAMSRTVYLNGALIPPEQARVSIFDRAVLFGDAIYEVAGVLDGKLVDFDNHIKRMVRSLDALSIPQPLDRGQVLDAYRKLVSANQLDEGMVYMQISRGVAERDFVYAGGLTPTVFMFTQVKSVEEKYYPDKGIALKSVPDIRWARRDIKSVNLLGQVLAKQSAHEAGAYEALMIGPDGYVTECGSTSFFMVTGNTIITRPLSNEILPGITRQALIQLCETNAFKLVQRAVTLEEVFSADEAFISGASTYILPVTKVDDRDIGSGRPGKTCKRLREVYIAHARATAI